MLNALSADLIATRNTFALAASFFNFRNMFQIWTGTRIGLIFKLIPVRCISPVLFRTWGRLIPLYSKMLPAFLIQTCLFLGCERVRSDLSQCRKIERDCLNSGEGNCKPIWSEKQNWQDITDSTSWDFWTALPHYLTTAKMGDWIDMNWQM